jgi:hypothetical protein
VALKLTSPEVAAAESLTDTTTLNAPQGLQLSATGYGPTTSPVKAMSFKQARKYAMKMGMTDSTRGLQQMYANLTNKSSLLETLKKKDEKLKSIFENPDYGDKAFQAYLGSAIALDPIGWIPLVGWAKKSKSLTDAAKYGAGMGGAYSALSYVGEGESRLLNAATGVTAGGVLGLGGGAIARAVTKSLGRKTAMPSSTDIQKKNIEDRALLTRQGKDLSPEETDEVISKAIAQLEEQKPEVIGEGIKSFYKDIAGDKVWDLAVQNWGSALVGVAAGAGGYNAFEDPESTQEQKIMAGLLFALGGASGTKALSKVMTKNGTLGEVMASGIVDNYGLSKRYTDVIQSSIGDVNTVASKFAEVVEELQTLSTKERQTLTAMITGEIDDVPELVGFKIKTRNTIKKAGQMMVDAGLLSQEVFNKNSETYLKRTYEKYLRNDIDKSGYQAARQLKLIGDELRARGVGNTKQLSKAAYERSLNPSSKTFGDYEGYTVVPLTTTVAKSSYDKILNKIEKQRVEKISNYKLTDTVKDIRDWKVLSNDGEFVKLESTKEITLTADYTKAQRKAMGEIEDAAFNVAETGRLMTNDLSTFKVYENIAKDDVLSMTKLGYESKLADGSIQASDWVKVPEDSLNELIKVAGKPIKKYGQLAGKYVPKEVYDDLTRIQKLKDDDNQILSGYLAINRLWKKSKTAWNPVVHVNNTVSNIILYDLADASYKFMGRGFKELNKGLNKEKDSEIFNLAKQYGVFDVDLVSKELTKQGKEIGDDILSKLSDDILGEIGGAQKYSEGVYKKLASKGYDMTAGKLEKFYQMEDQAFRMGLFMDRLSKGMSPAEAAADAKKWFIDYDINAPLINMMRRGPTPFLSYTYRVIPLLAEAAIRRPWKFAKWSLGAYLLNEAGNAMGPGTPETERELMRDEMKQKLFGMPFLPSTTIKTPFASERKGRDGESIPLYIDVKRFIPGGDVFSVGEKGIGIPIPFTDSKSLKLPSTLTPSFGALGEIFIPLMTGVDPFTLREIEGLGLGNDDAVKLQHIMSRLTPNIPSTAFSVPLFEKLGKEPGLGLKAGEYTPFNETFGSKKIVKAFRQAQDGLESQYGTKFTPFEAIMSTFGFKLQPIEISQLLGIKQAEFKRYFTKVKLGVNTARKDMAQGKISKEEAEKKIDTLYRGLEKEVTRYQILEDSRVNKVKGGYVVPQVKDDPKNRVDPFTGEPYIEEDTEKRDMFLEGGEVNAFTPLESEIQQLQSQAESNLTNPDLYIEGIQKEINKRKGFLYGSLVRRKRFAQGTDEPITEEPLTKEAAKSLRRLMLEFEAKDRGWEGQEQIDRVLDFQNKVAQVESDNMPNRIQGSLPTNPTVPVKGKEGLPGRGKYQVEKTTPNKVGSNTTWVNRTLNYFGTDAKGKVGGGQRAGLVLSEEDRRLLSQPNVDFSTLPEGLQDVTMTANMLQHPDFSVTDLANGKLPYDEAYVDYHWAGWKKTNDLDAREKKKTWFNDLTAPKPQPVQPIEPIQ